MSLELALLSLDGLSVGDAFGERFFGPDPKQRITHRILPAGPWRWTDDTDMACSIVLVLREYGEIYQDALAQQFAARYQADPYRGYGGGARRLLGRLAQGEDWRTAAPELFNGGSYGNGGAMRAAPIGGFYDGDPARAAEQARLSAEVTHAHPEGQAGAMAIASAAAIAAQGEHPRGVDFLQAVLPYVPEGLTRQGIEDSLSLPAEDVENAARRLGTGKLVAAQDTVPFSLWCAAHYMGDFKQAMWQTVLGLGDRDTTCAIAGGIVALAAGSVPADWLERREELPVDFSFSS